jgi:mannose/fructose/N-acetylgalactosamine-specific phosphotransferase system component IIC
MIQIPLALAVIIIIVVHTIMTHLFNWAIRESDDQGDINAVVLCLFFSFLEVTLTIALLCEMKPV